MNCCIRGIRQGCFNAQVRSKSGVASPGLSHPHDHVCTAVPPIRRKEHSAPSRQCRLRTVDTTPAVHKTPPPRPRPTFMHRSLPGVRGLAFQVVCVDCCSLGFPTPKMVQCMIHAAAAQQSSITGCDAQAHLQGIWHELVYANYVGVRSLNRARWSSRTGLLFV